MKYLVLVLCAAAAAATAMSMAWPSTFKVFPLASPGGVAVTSFDIVIFGAIALVVVRNALHLSPDQVPVNRTVLRLCGVYFLYQVLIVFPVAVVGFNMSPVDVARQMEVRLAIVLVPFCYSLALDYWKPSVLIAIFDVAAVLLACSVLYNYATKGGVGYWDGGIYRLRVAWGGSTLLFAWVFFTSLFYWPPRPWRLALAALGAGSLLLVNHRSGILALALAFIIQILAMRGAAKRATVAVGLFVALVAAAAFSSPFVRNSLAYSFDTLLNPNADVNAQDRVSRPLLAMQYFWRHPWGDWIWHRTYYLVDLGANRNYGPHNFVVQLLVAQGVIGTVLYLAPVAVVVALAWKNRGDRQSSVMLAYVTFYLVFCLLNANIDFIENVALLYIAMALVLDVNRRRWLERQESLEDLPVDCAVPARLLPPSCAAVYSRGDRADNGTRSRIASDGSTRGG